MVEAIGSRILPVCGDITKPSLGLSDVDREKLTSVSHIIHTAAETGIQNTREHLWQINVAGTEQVLGLAAGVKSLQRFVHISTAYVAGQRKGLIREDDPLPARFGSLYEESKAEAEKLVAASMGNPPMLTIMALSKAIAKKLCG